MRKIIASLALVIAVAAPAGARTIEEVTDSLKNIETQARAGDPKAQNELGIWFYTGKHVDQNYEQAVQWWLRAAKQNHSTAFGNLGMCYRFGNGIEQDSIKAVQHYIKAIQLGNEEIFNGLEKNAKAGDVFANMVLATCYTKGYGVDKSNTQAIPYYTAAANAGNVSAMRDLGMLFINSRNNTDALPWFKKGMAAGDLVCTFYSGKMILQGMGTKANPKEGANYLLKAAEEGFPQAMYLVGECYMTGNGLTKNAEQAVVWYKRAAGKGAQAAQWDLATCYREGNGIGKDYDQALYWYGEAAAQGRTTAFKKLITDTIPGSDFVIYLKGIKAYNNKDFKDALDYFKKVEKAKVIDGKVMTAVVYANKDYQKKDVKKSVKLLKECIKAGNVQAMYFLGGLYEAGKGVDKDMKEAVRLMTEAADLDYAPAEYTLADMYYEGRGVDQDYAKAVELYAKAYAQGRLSESAAMRYATCYQDGKGGLEPDAAKAEEIRKSVHKNFSAELLRLI